MQNIQGAKYEGYTWYQLLARVFKSLGMKLNSTYKGICIWVLNEEKPYLVSFLDF